MTPFEKGGKAENGRVVTLESVSINLSGRVHYQNVYILIFNKPVNADIKKTKQKNGERKRLLFGMAFLVPTFLFVALVSSCLEASVAATKTQGKTHGNKSLREDPEVHMNTVS